MSVLISQSTFIISPPSFFFNLFSCQVSLHDHPDNFPPVTSWKPITIPTPNSTLQSKEVEL